MCLATGKLAFFINKGFAEDLVFRGTFGTNLGIRFLSNQSREFLYVSVVKTIVHI